MELDKMTLDDKLDAAILLSESIEDRLSQIETNNRINRLFIILVAVMAVAFPFVIGAIIYQNIERNCQAINEGRAGRIRDAETLIFVATRDNPDEAKSQAAMDYLNAIKTNNKPLDCH